MSAMSDYYEGECIKGTFRSHGMTAWAASTAYSQGDRVWATNAYGPYIFECTTAGTSGATQPTWTVTLGGTTADNTATWTCYFVGMTKRPLYVALFTAAPSDSGGGTEMSGGSYARAQLDPADANWDAPAAGDGHTQNASSIAFPTPTASWGVATHFGVFDKATGGNLLFHGALTTSKTINNGDPAPSFAIGALDVTFA